MMTRIFVETSQPVTILPFSIFSDLHNMDVVVVVVNSCPDLEQLNGMLFLSYARMIIVIVLLR
jgi:hypothetical protein